MAWYLSQSLHVEALIYTTNHDILPSTHFNSEESIIWYLPSTVPAGSLAKAASVGAKTVKGPLPERVSASPQAVTAAMVQEIDIDVSDRCSLIVSLVQSQVQTLQLNDRLNRCQTFSVLINLTSVALTNEGLEWSGRDGSLDDVGHLEAGL